MALIHKAREASGSRRAVVALIALVVIGAAGYWIFQHSIYWRIKPLIEFIGQVPFSHMRTCLCTPQREVEFRRDDGLRIRGSLYGHISDHGQPTLLILHGNTPLGRKLALYEILADKLAKRGYLVLTIDRAGSGESDDPFTLGTVEALDAKKDVYAAVDYLRSLQRPESFERYGVHVIAHSGGAIAALSAGIKHPDIKTITLIGPPRRDSELLSLQRWRDYYWHRMQARWQKVYGHSLPAWFTQESYVQWALNNDMVKYVDYFASAKHKPLLLLDGGLESEEDRRFLRDYYHRITQPKRYVTIPSADHYSNTTTFHAGLRALIPFRLDLYDKDVVDRTVAEIGRWIDSASIGKHEREANNRVH
jgi:pimeloyl-ACP methyl ester carboxylesterase